MQSGGRSVLDMLPKKSTEQRLQEDLIGFQTDYLASFLPGKIPSPQNPPKNVNTRTTAQRETDVVMGV